MLVDHGARVFFFPADAGKVGGGGGGGVSLVEDDGPPTPSPQKAIVLSRARDVVAAQEGTKQSESFSGVEKNLGVSIYRLEFRLAYRGCADERSRSARSCGIMFSVETTASYRRGWELYEIRERTTTASVCFLSW